MRLAVLSSHPIQYYTPLFRELAQRMDVHVYFAHKATPKNQADAGFATPFEWDVDLISSYEHSFLTNVSRQPGTNHFFGCDTPGIDCLLRAEQFDAVLMMGWYLKSFIQGLAAAKRMGLPVLVRGDSHLETPRSRIKNISKMVLYPPFLRFFDAALYVGSHSLAYYQHFHYPTNRLFFSPHCVDVDWFSARATAEAGQQLRLERGIGPNTKVLLFAGKLVAFKRPLDLVAAAQKCRANGMLVEVMIAGDGPLASELQAFALASGVPLHFFGFCNQSKMPAVYAASDVLVLPSDGYETWGLVANEALACGRPIILSSAVGAGPDLADSKDTGRIFEMANIDALTGAITDLLGTPCSSAKMLAKSCAYSPRAAADGVEAACKMLRRPTLRSKRVG